MPALALAPTTSAAPADVLPGLAELIATQLAPQVVDIDLKGVYPGDFLKQLGALGGLAALHLRGMTLNVSSAVGFIALFGVAVMDGILMVSNLNRLRRESTLSLKDAVIAGASQRFRPVLMTATVAALGLLPAALATGLGSDVQRPLATVVVVGLITATGLTLVWLPALYFLVERWFERREAARPAPPHDGEPFAA